MKKYIQKLVNSKLFFNMVENEIESVLHCLSANVKSYKKGEYIFNVGDTIENIALIIMGNIHLEKEDFLGNKTILSHISENDIFGASYYYNNEPISFNIISSSDSIIMFLNIKKAFDMSYRCCPLNIKISKNFIDIILRKNRTITKKIEHISQRTIRNKLVSYLSEEAFRNNSNSFYIKFNRQQLADYLCIDRSALSNELSKMRNEGILNFSKNYFELNNKFNSLNF